jgi:hypothetical protein
VFRQNGNICDCFNDKRSQHLHVMGVQPFTLKRFNGVCNTIWLPSSICSCQYPYNLMLTSNCMSIDTNNPQGMQLGRFKNRTPARFEYIYYTLLVRAMSACDISRRSKEIGRSCVFVLWVLILSLSLIFPLDFEIELFCVVVFSACVFTYFRQYALLYVSQ